MLTDACMEELLGQSGEKGRAFVKSGHHLSKAIPVSQGIEAFCQLLTFLGFAVIHSCFIPTLSVRMVVADVVPNQLQQGIVATFSL
jgi:hypothetical protein